MNAQEKWKKLYTEWKKKPICTFGDYPKYSWRGMMRSVRREAALERRLEAAQRTIEAHVKSKPTKGIPIIAEITPHPDSVYGHCFKWPAQEVDQFIDMNLFKKIGG